VRDSDFASAKRPKRWVPLFAVERTYSSYGASARASRAPRQMQKEIRAAAATTTIAAAQLETTTNRHPRHAISIAVHRSLPLRNAREDECHNLSIKKIWRLFMQQTFLTRQFGGVKKSLASGRTEFASQQRSVLGDPISPHDKCSVSEEQIIPLTRRGI